MYNYFPKVKKGDKVWVVFDGTYEGTNALGEPIISWSEAKKPDEIKCRSSTVPSFALITNELLEQG